LNKGSILTGFFCLLVLGLSAAGAEPKLLGDESDGSMSPPPHLIPLYAENEDGQKGEQVTPEMEFPMPFSTRWSCSDCHDYNLIKKGWHFNTMDSNVPAGRPGEPWVYYDPRLCLQIPLSYRGWSGTFRPEQIGLSEFKFTKIFGRHFPGDGPGEVDATDGDDIGRQLVSGKLEINCLACHNAHPGQDMGGLGGYAVQVSRENFRWAAAASCEFASVTGSAAQMLMTYDPFMPDPTEKNAPMVTYRKEVFNDNNEVLLDIVRQVPNERCYYCHSDLYHGQNEKTEKWTQDEDIHLTAGLKCVDCHRNGVDHNIIRGYDNEADISDNPLAATSSCEGCHLPQDDQEPAAGRLGAPVPKHPGIPTIHFDRLTCTACHCGPWPDEQAVLTKTSRANRLGTPNSNKAMEGLPHILSPVFASQGESGAGYKRELMATENGKIAPYKVLWPSYWGILEQENVRPIELSVVEKVIGGVFADIELAPTGDWPQVTKEMIAEAIKALSTSVAGQAVYIGGGKLYSLDDSGQLLEQDNHPAAKPYLWPLAHNVRPAAQSLGVRYCTDCHATNAPFFFGDIKIDSPLIAEQDSFKRMIEFQDISPSYAWAFAASFVFRPWLKIIAIGSCVVMAGVLLLYALRALACIVKVLTGENQ
jgi:Zn-finger protein